MDLSEGALRAVRAMLEVAIEKAMLSIKEHLEKLENRFQVSVRRSPGVSTIHSGKGSIQAQRSATDTSLASGHPSTLPYGSIPCEDAPGSLDDFQESMEIGPRLPLRIKCRMCPKNVPFRSTALCCPACIYVINNAQGQSDTH